MGPAIHPLLSAGYLASGFVMAGIYVPQLVRGWRNPRATVLAQSLSSWTVWAACRVVALLYGCLVIGDPLFILAVGLDLLGRLAVLAVLLRAMWLQAWPRHWRALSRLWGLS
ncbi:MAG: hypothetical protein ABIV63_01360 [Caldimonas sp.]